MTISYSSRGTPTMEQIKNVSADTAANGEILIYNSTTELWENGSAGAGATEIVDTQNIRSLTNNTGTALTAGALNNIILGEDCGDSITTGDNNTVIGKNILRAGDPQRNILLGENIGLQTTGGYNVCLGFNMANNISQGLFANNNIMIGRDVGGGRTVGSDNVFIGREVNNNNGGTSIINNVMIGRQAGSDCRSNANTFVGYGAGQVNVSGNGNTSLGRLAGRGNNSNYTVNIGFEAGRSRGSGNDDAICIGRNSGNAGSGANSIQIGYRANFNTPASYDRVIVLNATGVALESTQSDTCKIAPVRPIAHNLGTGIPFYDTSTGELSVSSTDITKASAKFATDPTNFTTGQNPVIFDATNYNVNSGYNTTTGIFTAPVNGLYNFEHYYLLEPNQTATFIFKVNSLIVQTHDDYSGSGTGVYRAQQNIFNTILGAGDTVELQLFALSGTVRYSATYNTGLRIAYVGK